MTELEKVEKLREKADVTFAEAKEALEIAGGDILEALIYLERQGRSTVPAGGGYFSGAGASYEHHQQAPVQKVYKEKKAKQPGETFGDMMRRFGRFCLDLLNKGNTNFLDASRGGNLIFSCPVTALVMLLIFFFWVVVPLFIVSLFFGFRYHFRGKELGRDSVNNIMDNAAGVVEDVKKSFAEHTNNGGNANNNTGNMYNNGGNMYNNGSNEDSN